MQDSPLTSKERRKLRRRHLSEILFRALGLAAVLLAAGLLTWLLYSIVSEGAKGLFSQKQVYAEIYFDPEFIDPQGTRNTAQLRSVAYGKLIHKDLGQRLEAYLGNTPSSRRVRQLVSFGAENLLRQDVLKNTSLIGTTQSYWFPVSNLARNPYKNALEELGLIRTSFNWNFFTHASSDDPGTYGILGAALGSFWALLVCFLLSFPLAVLAAIYLEELAPKNRLTDLIEINISNLAAVPSIVFGLLGLVIFLTWFGLERSTAFLAGLVLAILTLPTIIVSARASLQAVPPSLREAALGLGLSHQQAIWHFIVPQALPGIITGTIIGLARALGETAPLLFIGLIGKITTIPKTPFEPAPTLASEIFNLFTRGEVELKSYLSNATIMVLLAILVLMNLSASLVRRWAEKRR